jgi:hypothetical protein
MGLLPMFLILKAIYLQVPSQRSQKCGMSSRRLNFQKLFKKKKRRYFPESTSSNEVLREKRSKLHQAKLNYAVVQPISNKEKSAVDQLIFIYIINEARSLELVESLSFRAMFSGLNPRANTLCVKVVVPGTTNEKKLMKLSKSHFLLFIICCC